MNRIAASAAELNRLPDIDQLSETELREAIESILPLCVEQIVLAGQRMRWYRASNPEPLLEEAVSPSSIPAADIDPFWAADWRAAFGMDDYLNHFDCDGTRILELGAGSGRAGIAAAMRGALVTITDTVDLAMLVARLNSYLVRDRVTIRRLRWAEELLDEPAFPLVIGSDLVYDPSHFPQLEQCARQHLAPGGHWLLSEPQRHTGDRFAKWIIEAGWKCDIHLLDLKDERIPMRIFDCQVS